MKVTGDDLRLISKYAKLDFAEDDEQSCLHIWVSCGDGMPRIQIECNHIQIFPKESTS